MNYNKEDSTSQDRDISYRNAVVADNDSNVALNSQLI